MTLSIQYVHQNHAAQSWPLAEPHIAEAIEHGGGDYTLEQAKLLVNTGQWMLLVATGEDFQVKGAATVNFLNYPNDRIAFITFIGGKLISNKDTFKQMCDILKVHGATKIQGMARPAIARLWSRYGFEERTTLVEAKL
jgi:hypothetical protein